MYQYVKVNAEHAVKNWSGRLSEATGVRDAQKLRTMSILAETKMAIDGPVNLSEKKLMEAYGVSTTGNILGMGPVAWGSDPGTGVGAQQGAWHRPDYKAGSGDLPSMIMGMAMNVAAYCVGFDLVTTIAVDMPSAFFQFLDSVYAGGSIDGESGEHPIYVQFAAKEIAGKFYQTNKFTYGENLFLVGADNGAIAGRYMGTSFVTGAMILKIESTGQAADTAYTADNLINIATIINNNGDAMSLYRGTSATVINTATNIALTEVKPDLVSSIREHIQGFSNNDGITKDPMSRAQTEKGTRNKLNLRLWSKTCEMKGREIEADITKVQLRDLRAYGVDGLAQLYKAAQNQLIQDINDEIIERLAALGVKNHAQLLAAQGMNLNLFVAPASEASKAFTAFGVKFVDPTGADRAPEFGDIVNGESNSAAENQGTRQRRIYSRILAASSMISVVGRYGKGDVAVVGPQLSAALQDCQGFTPYPMENTLGRSSDLHMIGTIGQIKVYENPKWNWNDTRVVVNYRGTEETPGLKMLAYDLASSVEIISETTMAPKISVLSRYDLIDAGFFPETQTITFACNTSYNGGSWI